MWLRSVRKLLSNAFGDVGHCSDPTLGCTSSAPSGQSAAPRILHGVILTIPMPLKLDVFVPQGYKKGPQTGWCKTTEIYFLTVAKAGSSKSRCWQGRVPLRLWVEPFRASCSFWWRPSILGIPWLAATTRQPLPPLSRGVLPVCLCLQISLFV